MKPSEVKVGDRVRVTKSHDTAFVGKEARVVASSMSRDRQDCACLEFDPTSVTSVLMHDADFNDGRKTCWFMFDRGDELELDARQRVIDYLTARFTI